MKAIKKEEEIGKQLIAYEKVMEFRSKHPNCYLRDAIISAALSLGTTYDAVRAAYYTHAHRNGDPIARRKNSKAQKQSARARNKKLASNIVIEKQEAVDANLDINIVLASLREARTSLDRVMALVDKMEQENKRNKKVIEGLRYILTN